MQYPLDHCSSGNTADENQCRASRTAADGCIASQSSPYFRDFLPAARGLPAPIAAALVLCVISVSPCHPPASLPSHSAYHEVPVAGCAAVGAIAVAVLRARRHVRLGTADGQSGLVSGARPLRPAPDLRDILSLLRALRAACYVGLAVPAVVWSVGRCGCRTSTAAALSASSPPEGWPTRGARSSCGEERTDAAAPPSPTCGSVPA